MRKAFLAISILAAAAGCSAAPTEADSLGSEALTSRIPGVTFQTQLHGNFVGAQNDGGGNVIATATVAQGWETFTLFDQNGGTLQSGDEVFIQAGNGDYFQAANGGGSMLNVTRKGGRRSAS